MNRLAESGGRVNCFHCKHYYVTWDPSFPRGCKSYGIKTSALPSAAVLSASGKPCMAFALKDRLTK